MAKGEDLGTVEGLRGALRKAPGIRAGAERAARWQQCAACAGQRRDEPAAGRGGQAEAAAAGEPGAGGKHAEEGRRSSECAGGVRVG